MGAGRVEEAGEPRIQITRVAKLAHDPAQLGLEPDGATVRQRGLEQRQRGPQLPYGNPALVQWLRSADIAELLGLIRQPLQAIACYHPKGVKDRHGPVQRYRLPAGHWSPVPRIRINSGNAPPM